MNYDVEEEMIIAGISTKLEYQAQRNKEDIVVERQNIVHDYGVKVVS